MSRMTNRTRLRIDLALADADRFSSSAPGRRQLLAPPAPVVGTDRLRPTLLAPLSGSSARSGSPEPLGS
jgi:hypothetical protein